MSQPFYQDSHVTLYCGDALETLRELPDASVQCAVTSPPYWGLRDYGVAGQLGLEATPDSYVAGMVDVFREVRRVLREDGTLWLNLGDSYASGGVGGAPPSSTLTGGGGRYRHGSKLEAMHNGGQCARAVPCGLKPKDLVGIPWRVSPEPSVPGELWVVRAGGETWSVAFADEASAKNRTAWRDAHHPHSAPHTVHRYVLAEASVEEEKRGQEDGDSLEVFVHRWDFENAREHKAEARSFPLTVNTYPQRESDVAMVLAGAPEHQDQGRGQDEGYCDRCGVTVAPKGCALAECGWCKGARPPEYNITSAAHARPRDEEVERLAASLETLAAWAEGKPGWRITLNDLNAAAAVLRSQVSPVREAQEPEKLVEKVGAALYALYISGRRQEARDNWTPESFRADATRLLTDCGLLPRRKS